MWLAFMTRGFQKPLLVLSLVDHEQDAFISSIVIIVIMVVIVIAAAPPSRLRSGRRLSQSISKQVEA